MSNKPKWNPEELTCKPLDTYNEILLFLQDPPAWRTLCKELKPHSKYVIKNSEINKHIEITSLECPQTFCHINPDAEDVKRHEEKKLPKTLVCHDMANGYHDDSIIDGTGNYDTYTFYNWACIDIFCYFSHHLITIPPLAWINVAHEHGVKVIGTVITEWAEGVVFWNKILDSEVEWKNFASALVAIAKTLKFDGWLLNIENKISKPEVLLMFVRHLHRLMHQELTDPVLVWYDSVTVQGLLTWQNALNEKNKAFFDICDGFFTNYSWTEEHIASSVAMAGDRLSDLYIGVDVWGRNFFGGGQFNTQEAIKLIHKYGCSTAIFAPAWTHEAISDDVNDINTIGMSQGLSKYEKFLLRDRALWGSLWPFLNTKLPNSLPFQTSFCRGQGKKRRMYGEVLCPVPWYNLRHMQYQPNSAHGAHGYLLSTLDRILAVSRHGVFKDKKGIIRYRESFHMSRVALHSIKGPEMTSSGNEVLVVNDDDEEEEEEDEEVRTEGSLEDQHEVRPKSMKRKMKNAFRHLFRMKASRPSDINTVEEQTDEPEGSSGKSMVQMSVNLRLGNNTGKTRYELAWVPEERECLEHYLEDSFIGGSCLRIHPSDNIASEHRSIRIFHCDFFCENTLIFCVVTKKLPGFESQFLNVILRVKDANGVDLKVILIGRDVPQMESQKASKMLYMSPLKIASDGPFREMQKYLLLHEPKFYIPVENSFNWHVRYYEVKQPKSTVTSVLCRTGVEQGPVLLGHFGICHRPTTVSSTSA